jgi:Ca2+-binding RTX toxin-like protein
MSVQDLVNAGKIFIVDGDGNTLEPLSPLRSTFIGYLEEIYGTTAGRLLLDKLWLTNSDPVTIAAFVGGAVAGANRELRLVGVTAGYQLSYINDRGVYVLGDTAGVLAHELVHVIENMGDTEDDLTGQRSNPDYMGETVRFTNPILQQLGEGLRISYSAADEGVGTRFAIGTSFTRGEVIDVALFTSVGSVDNNNATFPGRQPSTDKNTYDLRDLIIDVVSGNDLDTRTGLGRDFVYGGDGNDTIDGGSDHDVLYGGDNNDSLIGGKGDDELYGEQGDDVIDGGEGNDVINLVSENPLGESDEAYGGAGNDIVLFDVTDYVLFGEGFDLGIATAPSIVYAFNDSLDELQLEAIRGTQSADTFSTSGSKLTISAGSGGADTFNIQINGGSPTVVWGGDGADAVQLFGDTSLGGAGILVVNVAGLTEENFHLFDIEDLNLGSNFAWNEIDAVIINPDAQDRYFLNDSPIQAVTVTAQVIDYQRNLESGEFLQISMGEFVVRAAVPNPGQEFFASYPDAGRGPAVVRSVDIPDGFLNYSGNVLTSIQPFSRFVQEYRFELDGQTVTRISASYPEGGEIDVPQDEIDTVFGPYNIGKSDNYNLSGAAVVGDWTTAPPGYTADYRYHFFYWESTDLFDSAADVNLGWFIVGADLSSDVISSDGSISYTMPPPDAGPGPGGTQTPPRGGSYGGASSGSNLTSGEGTRRLAGFDAFSDSVVVNGVALTAASLSSGIVAYEANGSTVINYGADDNVVLRGVSLAAWQTGSASQIAGGAGADSLTGTSGADVIASGGGADTIAAGAGDDRINYTSGNDVIVGNATFNSGLDTLNLGRFKSSDVRFSISGFDVFITTPDGTIRLDYQTRYEIGHARSNIEVLLFSDSTLDEAGIRARAIADQSTTGSDSVVGTIYADTFVDDIGNDTITARDGNDTIIYAAGNDVIVGNGTANLGQDTLDLGKYRASDVRFSVSGWDVLVTTPDGVIRLDYQIRQAVGNVASNIETIIFSDLTLDEAGISARATGDQGTSGNDSITGTAYVDSISGLAGNDTINGFGENDTLFGGEGDDSLDGGTGVDSLIGGLGNDTYIVDSAGDVILELASEGTDTVKSVVSWTLAAHLENLILIGSAIVNGTGNTEANILTGNAAANLLSGLAGNDTLIAGDGNDTLQGGDGNDVLDGGLGIDSMTGGSGDDVYFINATTDVIVEATGGGIDIVQSTVTLTLLAEIENLTLTGSGVINGTGNAASNILTGNAAANSISGLAGNDSLFGGAGNDTLLGGDGDDILNGDAGTDSMTGGLGNDTYFVDATSDLVIETVGGGIDVVHSSVTHVLATEVENLVLIGSATINGTGNTLANRLTGNTAANILSGGTGSDTMEGGLGDDKYVVDVATDVLIEAADQGTDLVQSAVTLTLLDHCENLTLTGTSGNGGTGNGAANTLTGNSGANTLSGLAGNDTIIGGSGNDTLLGGDGDDSLDGGAGTDSMTGGLGNDTYVVDVTADVVVEAASGGTDTVRSGVAWTLGANVENLIQTGTSGITGTGNALANAITGNTGNNSLSGLDGNDTLIGGGGNDSLNGGNGADQFVFNSTTSGIDVIADFNELNGGGEEGDVLRFDALRLGTFVYRGTSAFTGGSDNSEARVSGSQVLVDTNGDGTADITITLTGLTAATQLAAADFVFV